MLQRIQTVWLFLSSLSVFSLLLFPYMHLIEPNGTVKAIKATGIYENVNGQTVQTEQFLSFTIATILVALLPLVVISFYKNRKRQIIWSYLVILAIIAYGFWLAQYAKAIIGNVQVSIQNYGIGAFLPSVAILFIILALRGIRNDEKLIRSADRLR